MHVTHRPTSEALQTPASPLRPRCFAPTGAPAGTASTTEHPDKREIGGPSIKWGQISHDRMLALNVLDMARMNGILTRVSSEASVMVDNGMKRRDVVCWLDTAIAAYEEGARAQMRMSPRNVQDPLHPYGDVPDLNVFGTVPIDTRRYAWQPAAGAQRHANALPFGQASPPWAAQLPAHRADSTAAEGGNSATAPTPIPPPVTRGSQSPQPTTAIPAFAIASPSAHRILPRRHRWLP